jgi:hypothetical protein
MHDGHGSTFPCRALDCTDDLEIGAAPADIAVHLPSTRSIGMAQERTARPSMCTVQARQNAIPLAEFGASHLEVLAQHPQERRVSVHVNFLPYSIDREGDYACLSVKNAGSPTGPALHN